ncbi:hypothetical protein SDC9_99866 [bioreactor metagenome]|uniref:Uncharacterized protein n=1 Tax=bioreactor metagenome TaxID=1076179 RepID=A0A645AIP0_9ZZZZ
MFLSFAVQIAFAQYFFVLVQEGFAAVLDVRDRQLHEAAVRIQRHTPMEQKIIIVAQIHAAFAEKELDVLLQSFRIQEASHESFYN